MTGGTRTARRVRRVALALWYEERFLVRFWTALAIVAPVALIARWLA